LEIDIPCADEHTLPCMKAFSTEPQFAVYQRCVRRIEVGPVWSHDHAVAVGDAWCKCFPNHSWTGHWNTTVDGEMSVLEIDIPCADEHTLPCMKAFSTDRCLFAPYLGEEMVTIEVEVGPLYSCEHASAKAAEWIAEHPLHRWNQDGWATTVPGKMSILQMQIPASEADRFRGRSSFNEDHSLFDAINHAPVRLAACHAAGHSDNLVVVEDDHSALGKANLCYMEGAEGWISWNVAAQMVSSPAARMIISYAAADPRPLKVLVDGVVVTEVCDGTTGGWEENSTRWVAHVPFMYEWNTAHEIRLEGDAFFPHITEFVLVPCEVPAPAEQITALVGMLGDVVNQSDSDVSKALGLINVLRQAADELAGSLIALHHKNESVKRAAGKVTEIAKAAPALPAPQAAEVPKPEGPLHKGVCCDGCGMHPIVGVRYKCMNCPDYDLCEGCEARGVHDHHVFLKLKQPLKVVHQATWTTDEGQNVAAGEQVVPTPAPESVPAPAPLQTGVPEDPAIPAVFQASFVKDVTVDDGTVIKQGETFTKVWRLQNTGSNVWPANVELQPVGPSRPFLCELHGATGIPVPSVAPGDMVDVSLDMTTPLDKTGDATMYFRLISNSSGQHSAHHFWVTVHVIPAPCPPLYDTAPAPAPAPMPEVNQQAEQLRNMGFWDDDQNAKALAESSGDIAAAVDWLLQHM